MLRVFALRPLVHLIYPVVLYDVYVHICVRAYVCVCVCVCYKA